MPVKDYCQSRVCTVDPKDTAREAAQLMQREGVGCLVVLEAGRPVGLVTDRDLALHLLCEKLDPRGVRIEEIVQRRVMTIRDDAPVAEAARWMCRHAVRRLPVVDREDRLVGLIAADDLLQLAIGELSGLAVAIRSQAARALQGR